MAELAPNNDVIVVRAPHRQAYLAQQVPGSRWHPRADAHGAGGHWAYPVSWAACVGLRGVFGSDLAVGPQLSAWATREKAERIAPALAVRDLLDCEGDPRLRPYQRPAVKFLRVAGSAILADEMRVGKMIETIVALRELNARPTLVICPNSVKYTWEERLADWWPDAAVAVVGGSAAQRRRTLAAGADVIVINWESLRLHTRLAGYGSAVARVRCVEHGGVDGTVTPTRCELHPKELNVPWAAVVADEAHHATNPRAKQTRALWAVGQEAGRRYALSGTPDEETEDWWPLGRFVAPEEYPSKTTWLDRYCFTGWNLYGGLDVIGLREDTKAELFSFLDPRLLRRTRAMVLPDEEPTFETRWVDLAPKQRRAYNEMKETMLTELDDGSVVYVTDPRTKVLRLRQFAAAYARLTDEGAVELTLPSTKVDALREILEEYRGRQVAVFAESRKLIELAGAALTKVGVEVGYVTGPVPVPERQRVLDAFQRGDLRVILLTLGAGGEGLTLNAASTSVFLQRTYHRQAQLQAEARIIGAGPSHLVYIEARDTVEQNVEDVLAEKGSLSETVLRDKETFRRLLG